MRRSLSAAAIARARTDCRPALPHKKARADPESTRASHSLFRSPRLQTEVPENSVQDPENLIEQVGERTWLIEQAGHRAEQVAEQISRARHRGDVEHNLIEVDGQSEEIEVQRSEHQIENRAGSRRDRRR